jgi:hypothetical protein
MTGVSLSTEVKCEVERDLLVRNIGSGDEGCVFCWLDAREAGLGADTARILRGLSPRSLLTSRGKAAPGPDAGPRDVDLRFRDGLETGDDDGGEESGEEVPDLGACGGLEEAGGYLPGTRTTRVLTTVVEVDARDDPSLPPEKKLVSGWAGSIVVIVVESKTVSGVTSVRHTYPATSRPFFCACPLFSLCFLSRLQSDAFP